MGATEKPPAPALPLSSRWPGKFSCARGLPAPGAVGVRVPAVNRLADAFLLAVEFFDPGHPALAK